MGAFRVSFAGHHVLINSDSEQVIAFLSLLFADLHSEATGEYEVELIFTRQTGLDSYALSVGTKLLYEGPLGIQAAAVIYDTVIYHLLNHNRAGIALHAGAVVHRGNLILVPGQSGAGKSSIVAWLTAHGLNYVTDELVFFPDPEKLSLVPFTRPICLKSGTAPLITSLLPQSNAEYLADEYGAIIPHRLLNPEFSPHDNPPELILFPFFQKDSAIIIEELSAAQATTQLLGCCANARNLEKHGFREIVKLARSVPIYRLTYGDFRDLDEAFDTLFSFSGWKFHSS
jgi:hypothetical protein